MPAPGTIVSNYEFGAPAVEAEVLRFSVRPDFGGRLPLRFFSLKGSTVTVTVQLSANGSSWADSAGIADQAVPAKTFYDGEVLIRNGVDKFVRVLAVGGDRCAMQSALDGILQMLNAA